MTTIKEYILYSIVSLSLILNVAADVGPFGYTKVDSTAALSWFIYLVAVAAITALVKGEGKTQKTLAIGTLFTMGCLWAFIAFILIDFLYAIVFFVVGLVGLSLGTAVKAISRTGFKSIKHKPFIVVTLLLIAILVQFNLFGGVTRNSSSLVTTGWTKFRPLNPSVSFQKHAFTATYVNGAGTDITIKENGTTAFETIAGEKCNITSQDRRATIKAGDTFTINCICPTKKQDGEQYDMAINISYTAEMSGITTEHMESGHIKGTGEAA